jgi:hypothetical protein
LWNTRPLRRGAVKVTSLMPPSSNEEQNPVNCTTGQLFRHGND